MSYPEAHAPGYHCTQSSTEALRSAPHLTPYFSHMPAPVTMTDKSDVCTGSVNPTRRAKNIAILPKPSSDAGSDADDEYRPADPQLSPPTKRGRKPGTMSRTAREAQRKLNHSIIEKARRTKINDALATLRTLVPEHFGEAADDIDDEEEVITAKAGGKKAEKEKEFKLEILVRTVSYMQHLIGRVNELEAASEQDGPKRKRVQHRDEDDKDEEQEVISHRRKRRNSQDIDRLPSISSWLQEDSVPPSPMSSSQLPTPPSSTAFAPVSQLFHSPPNFSLSSPVDDDHSAANILLHMSTSRRARQYDYQDSNVRAAPLTPSALLGLGRR